MKNPMMLQVVFLFLVAAGCSKHQHEIIVISPDKINTIEFHLSEKGQPFYMVSHNGNVVIDSSYMSFDFKNQESLKENFKVVNTTASSFNETWEMPWGEQRN